MTLRQIEFFLAVSKEGSITRAADAVHVSPPS
jgi:DNA-binding transcriptional LysR family regulator